MAKSTYAQKYKIRKRHKIRTLQKNMTAVVITTTQMMMTATTKLTMDNLTVTLMTMTIATALTATINYKVEEHVRERQLITLPATHLDVEQGGVEEGGDVLEEVKDG